LTESPVAAIGLEVKHARLIYRGAFLFDNLAIDLAAASWTCLLGPTGVGKTSLLRLIAGIAGPSASGEVAGGDGRGLAGRIAYMAQQDLLLPWLDVLDNVALGPRLRGTGPNRRDRERARLLLAELGLGGEEGSRPGELSGGMRQRVALARTLFEDRPLVLMDEPFSAVDAITRLKLQDLAARMLVGRTVLHVTHDPIEALRLGHRVLVMAGRPARITAQLEPPGVPPRAPADPRMPPLHAELLRHLETALVAA